MEMRLVLILSFVSCYYTRYVSGVTTQSSENAVVKETDTIEEVNVMKDNYHELLKRVMNNEIEIVDLKRREKYLKNELENIKRYMACQMEELNDFTEEKYDNLNETKAALMKTMISFSQSLTLLNETIQELSHRLEIQENLRREENLTECRNKSDYFYKKITSPGYPLAYSNNLNGNWSIDVGSGYTAKLQFTIFSTEGCCDFVKVYDAVHATDLIGSFSGKNLPPEMISTGRYMFVTFTSDGSVTKTGFSAYVYKITSK
ncbi:cubilin-like [Mytilus californianus]|uniref:cubilin-like n=1 Tax=Mytilus californianus TaxID=6549 RepID=UPI0022460EC7|nr:cubilin-like [Mytilus californianus]